MLGVCYGLVVFLLVLGFLVLLVWYWRFFFESDSMWKLVVGLVKLSLSNSINILSSFISGSFLGFGLGFWWVWLCFYMLLWNFQQFFLPPERRYSLCFIPDILFFFFRTSYAFKSAVWFSLQFVHFCYSQFMWSVLPSLHLLHTGDLVHFFTLVPKSLAVVMSEWVWDVYLDIYPILIFSEVFGGGELRMYVSLWIILSFFLINHLQVSVTLSLQRLDFISWIWPMWEEW